MSGETEHMARGRALLTDYEKEALLGEHGDQRRYEARSRFRSRVNERLNEEILFLAKEDPELLEELQAVVCENTRLANGLNAYVAVRDHPETGNNEIVFGGKPIRHVPYDEDGSDTLDWGYRGRGAANTARSILEHAISELELDQVTIGHKDQVDFQNEFIARQEGDGWMLPLSTVEMWVRKHMVDA